MVVWGHSKWYYGGMACGFGACEWGGGHGRWFYGDMACGCGGIAGGSVGVWPVGVGHGRKFYGGMASGCGHTAGSCTGAVLACMCFPTIVVIIIIVSFVCVFRLHLRL